MPLIFLVLMALFGGIGLADLASSPPSTIPSTSPPSPFPVPLASLQRTALLALWRAMGGSEWSYPTKIHGARWNFTAKASSGGDPCLGGWAGVTCAVSPQSPSVGSVAGLLLPGMMTSMSGLYSLPAEIGLLTDLTELDVSSNFLRMTLPANLSSCLALRTLNLGGNWFTGTVPELSALKSLSYFSVAYSQLQGPFPGFLLRLPGCQYIDLFRNVFSGSIPEAIGSLTGLTYLGLDKCAFSGTIPSSIGLLTRLTKLAVNGNRLQPGTLPSSLGNLAGLTYLAVHFSALTGSLPPSLGSISSLKNFRANDNFFQGTVPSTLGGLTNLQQLDLFNNTGLSGSLPSSLFGLSSLTRLDISNCSLGGPLRSIQAWASMSYLSLHTNSFTGPLDFGSASSFAKMSVFYVQRCKLSGTIPPSLGTIMPRLTSLILSENAFSGSIPRSIGTLSVLITLKLDNNRLSNGDTFGDASFVSGCKALQFLGLSANYFTGPMSPNFFSLASPQLHTIALSSNCLHGTLPGTMCQARSLQHLVMDGLSAGTACRRFFFPTAATLDAQLNGHMSMFTFQGTIPDCAYALPSLQKLHLSGNGLRGSLPSAMTSLPPNLTDISLANNLLVGTIPPAFQRLSRFTQLDLSYTMISGELLPELATSPALALKLKLMRLSGAVPAGVLRAGSVDILEGNLWTCGTTRDSLPPLDPFLRNFQCGSIAFDKYVYAFICVGAAAVLMIYLVGGKDLISISGGSQSVFTFKKLENVGNRAFQTTLHSLHNVKVLTHILLYTRKIAFIIAGGAFAALVPIYGILSLTSGTYQSEYSWTVSAIFKGGTAPAVALLLCWSVAIVGTNILILHYFRDDIEGIKARKDQRDQVASKKTAAEAAEAAAVEAQVAAKSDAATDAVADAVVDAVADAVADAVVVAAERSRVTRRHALMQLLLFARLLVIVCINCSATMAANIFYVDLAKQSNATVQVFSKSLLSFFKLVWNLQVLRFLCGPRTVDYIAVLMGAGPDEMKEVQKKLTVLKGASIFELILIIFNNIIAPVCATAFVDPQCFYHVFVALAPVETSYYVQDCTSSPKYGLGGVVDPKSLNTNCYSRVTSSQYNPDFTYTNQCSSVLIQFYAPVLMLVTLWPTFGRPLKDYLVRLFLNQGLWGAEQGLGGVQAPRGSLQAAHRWAQRRGYYFFLLKGLSSKLLWTDRELAFRKENDAHTVAYIYSWAGALALSSRPLSAPARTKASEPEATGGEIEADTPAPADNRGSPAPRRHRLHKFIDVPQYFLETLSDLTSLLTFGLICPILGMALGASIASRTMQWQYALVNFLLRRKGAFISPMTTAPSEKSKFDAVLCEELDTDCSKIYSGANPTKANWLLSLFSISFLGFFLLDMAASSSFKSTESGSLVQALWAPLLLLALPSLCIVLFRERLLVAVGSHRIQKRADMARISPRKPHGTEAGVESEAWRDDEQEEGREERESQEGDEYNRHNTVPESEEEDAAMRSSESVLAGMVLRASGFRRSVADRLSGDRRSEGLLWWRASAVGSQTAPAASPPPTPHPSPLIPPVAPNSSAPDVEFDIHTIHRKDGQEDTGIEMGSPNPMHTEEALHRPRTQRLSLALGTTPKEC